MSVEQQPQSVPWIIGQTRDGRNIVTEIPIASEAPVQEVEKTDQTRRALCKTLFAGTALAVTGLFVFDKAVFGGAITKRVVREALRLGEENYQSNISGSNNGSEKLQVVQEVESTPTSKPNPEITISSVYEKDDLTVVSEGEGKNPNVEIVMNKAKENPNIRIVMVRNGKNEQGSPNQTFAVNIFDYDLENINISPEKDLPLPPVVTYTDWSGGTQTLEVPEEYWKMILIAYEKTDTNPYLLAALADTESNWNPTVRSWAGAGGLFQFMPSTWPSYAKPGETRDDPLAASIAAGKMIKTIGVSSKFNKALAALAAEDKTAFAKTKEAFIKSFTGADGTLCWNMHRGQANAVFEGAINLTLAANK